MSAPYCYQYPHPAVTTDTVVFTIRDQQLQLLLIRRGLPPYEGMWALPGGFLDIDENIDHCAQRELQEETGLSGIYLEQLYTFGAPERDPRERVISVTYYAIVPADRLRPRAGSDAVEAAWYPLNNLPELAFDHDKIIEMAHQRLISKTYYSTIAFQFLTERFTLSELQSVYEILRGEKLDKRNFRKSILALGQIEETNELRRHGTHRPARIYRSRNPQRVEITR